MDIIDVELINFRLACDKLSKKLKEFNIHVEAFSDLAKKKASELSLKDLEALIREVEGETFRYSKMPVCEYTARWEHQQLWSFLKENQYTFSDIFFPNLEDGCFVAIYGSNSKAVYRSPNCYRETSYSIGDLFVLSWNELFYREEKHVSQILAASEKALASELGAILPLDSEIETHLCIERQSPKKLGATTKPLFFSTVENKDGGKFLVTVNKLSNIIQQ